MAEQPIAPYKGLIPYSDDDAALFYGRDDEREVIIANLMASRLTVLYGTSGVGKTSLLRAGVVHHLREASRAQAAAGRVPEFVVVPFASWRDDPRRGLIQRVRECFAPIGVPVSGAGAPDGTSLLSELQWWTEATGQDLLILLDQFEEYFVYHPDRDETGFADEFVRAVSHPSLGANFLISIREDAMSRLDRFKGQIPGLFSNVLRVEHLDLNGARDAIEKPIEWYNCQPGVTRVLLDSALVDAVLEEVRSGNVIIGEGARGVAKRMAYAERAADRVETPFLQLVLTRLWNDQRTATSRVLSLDTLRALGGSPQIVQMHMRETFERFTGAERRVAASILRYLVTPAGTKVAHTASDLASFAELRVDDVASVVKRLSAPGSLLLRSVAPPRDEPDAEPRYEIFHDVLAKPILEWRAWYANEQARERQERADAELRIERRRSHILKVFVGVLFLLLGGLGWLTTVTRQQRASLTRGREVAEQQALAANALAKLSSSPDLSLLLALSAMDMPLTGSRPPEVVDALRRALATSRALKPMFVHPETDAELVTAILSPDGERIAAAAFDGSIVIWNARNGQPVQTKSLSKKQVWLAFSPNGRYLGGIDGDGYLLILDGSSGELLARERTAAEIGEAIAFGGNDLVATGAAKEVIIWRIDADHRPMPIVPALQHSAGVSDVSFSTDSKRLAVAVRDGSAYLWDVTKMGAPLKRFRADDELDSIALSPDGTWLAAGGMARTVDVWDLTSGVKRSFRGHHNTVFDVAFSPDGTRIASASADTSARIWSTKSGEALLTLAGHAGPVQNVVFSPDGVQALTASRDGTARWWNVAGHAATIADAVFSPRESVLSTGGNDGRVKIWDAQTGDQLRDLGAQQGQIAVLSFSGDGSRLAALGNEGTARIWNTFTWMPVGSARFDAAHAARDRLDKDATAVSATLNSDGTLLAIGDDAGWVHVRQLQTGNWQCRQVSDYVEQIAPAFVGTSMRLATIGVLQDSMLWDASELFSRQILSKLLEEPVRLHQQHIFSAEFSRDGRWMVTASLDRTVRIWGTGMMTMIRELAAPHGGPVSDAAFSPDPDVGRVATASWDGKVRVFDRATGALQMVIGHEHPVQNVAFSPDGTRLASISVADVKPQIHVLDEAALVAVARARASRALTDVECAEYLHRPCAAR